MNIRRGILAKINPLSLAEKLTGRPMAEGTRHFFKDSIFYSGANFIPRLMGLILTPLITARITVGDYNVFNIYISAIPAICVIMSLQTELSVARYYYEDKEDFPDFLGTQFFFTLGMAALMIGQFWLFRAQWAWAFALTPAILLLAVATTLPQILHQVYFQLLLARKKSASFFNYSLAKQLIYTALAVAFLLAMARDRRIMGLVYAHLISTFALAAVFLYFILKEVRLVFRWKHLRYALLLTLPGVPGALSLFILNFFDRIYLGHHDRFLAGQYTFAYNLGMLIMMMTSGFFAAYMPRFYERRNKEETGKIQVLFGRNFKLLLLAAGGLILASNPIAHLLARNKDFWGGLRVTPIIVTGYLFMYLYQCFGLYVAYRRKFILLQSAVLILTGAANILLNIWLMPIFHNDIRIMALNTLFPCLAQWLAMVFIARVLLKEKTVHFKGLWPAFALYLAFAAAWCFVGY